MGRGTSSFEVGGVALLREWEEDWYEGQGADQK